MRHHTTDDMNKEYEYEELDLFTDESGDELMDELKAAAFEYLLLHPGSEFGDWQQGLISDYPTEVVDALGTDPAEVHSALADLWESDYHDPITGIEQKYCQWAMTFANEYSTAIYHHLIDTCNALRRQNIKS